MKRMRRNNRTIVGGDVVAVGRVVALDKDLSSCKRKREAAKQYERVRERASE